MDDDNLCLSLGRKGKSKSKHPIIVEQYLPKQRDGSGYVLHTGDYE